MGSVNGNPGPGIADSLEMTPWHSALKVYATACFFFVSYKLFLQFPAQRARIDSVAEGVKAVKKQLRAEIDTAIHALARRVVDATAEKPIPSLWRGFSRVAIRCLAAAALIALLLAFLSYLGIPVSLHRRIREIVTILLFAGWITLFTALCLGSIRLYSKFAYLGEHHRYFWAWPFLAVCGYLLFVPVLVALVWWTLFSILLPILRYTTARPQFSYLDFAAGVSGLVSIWLASDR